jgi:hypothetical protein
MKSQLLNSTAIPPVIRMHFPPTTYAELWLGECMLDRVPIAEDGRCHFDNIPMGAKVRVSVTLDAKSAGQE